VKEPGSQSGAFTDAVLSAELEIAVALALEAGTLLMETRNAGLEVRYKGKDDPVTQADLNADALIRDGLAQHFPGDGLLSEETVDDPSRLRCERVWIIDPLDGTSNFVRGGSDFAVSIGLAVRGEPVLGVVYNPARGELFAGAIGLGATLNDAPVTVTETRDLEDAQLLVSSSEWREGLKDFTLPIKPISSIAYKLALVAGGLTDGTFTANARFEWDVCAGAALVNVAGGIASLRDGSALTLNQPNPRLRWGILAAGRQLHAVLLEALSDLPTAAWAESRKR
jgi:myo-inositol-1(or 4)-monophosphatase